MVIRFGNNTGIENIFSEYAAKILIYTGGSMRLVQTILFVSLIFIFAACDIYDSNESDDEKRFKDLEIPIKGILRFVAGPSLAELDTLQDEWPWDFWQLSGTRFEKMNDIPLLFNQGQAWEFKWSPNGTYFSFYYDRDGDVINTDDIGIFDFKQDRVIYLTDSIGDANTYDEVIFHWSDDDRYIYFTALPLGESEYDHNYNPNIYRVNPENSLVEQITSNSDYEAHATPSPDGSKLAYCVFNYYGTPDLLAGYYILDLETGSARMIISESAFENAAGDMPWYHVAQSVWWHTDGQRLIINYFDKLVELDINTGVIELHCSTNLATVRDILFHPLDYDKLIIWGTDILLYDLPSHTIENLTASLMTTDSVKPYFGHPAVSPYGDEIAFTAQLDSISSDWDESHTNLEINIRNQKTEIYVMNLYSREIRCLTSGLLGWEGYLRWLE